jgi:hypothetical protein
MYMRKLFAPLGVVVFVVLLIGLLAACSLFGARIPVTSVTVPQTNVTLGLEGAARTYQITPTVYPQNASNRNVRYRVLDNEAAIYFSVSSTGLLTANTNNMQTPTIDDHDVAYIVRVESVSNPSVYADVHVSVMNEDIRRITFAQTHHRVVRDSFVEITPILTPYFASVSLSFAILNTDVVRASVPPNPAPGTISARVTGIEIGQTSLSVIATGTTVTGSTFILVTYDDLQYSTVPPTNPSAFKQLNTPELFEAFEVKIIAEDHPQTDTAPSITWKLNGATLDAFSGVNGAQHIKITPENFVEHGFNNTSLTGLLLSVELNSFGADRFPELRQTLEFERFFVYRDFNPSANPREFRAEKAETVQQTSYGLGQTVRIIASHTLGAYPPDSYEWFFIRGDGQEIAYRTTESLFENGAFFGMLPFRPEEEGSYHIRVAPVIKGITRHNLSHTIFVGDFTPTMLGNDIWGVYFDAGIDRHGNIAPVLKWHALAYFSQFEVEIFNVGGGTETFNSVENSALFTNRSFIFEGKSLNSQFDVRIKGSRHRDFSELFRYRGEIQSMGAGAVTFRENSRDVSIFERNAATGLNGFMPNLESLAELVNYIFHFRPASYAMTRSEMSNNIPVGFEGFKKPIYLGFAPAALVPDYFGKQFEFDPSSPANRRVQEYMYAIGIAFDNFGDTGKISWGGRELTGGAFEMHIYLPPRIAVPFETPNAQRYTKQNTHAPAYSTIGMQASEALPYQWIYSFNNIQSVSVTSSCQLYLAFSMGLRPVPVAGSQAQIAYNWARGILAGTPHRRGIIDLDMTDAERIRAIYHFLTFEVHYDHAAAAINSASLDVMNTLGNYRAYTIEGVMDGLAVCDGITKAYMLLSFMAGVSSRKIVGLAGSTSLSGHTWAMTFVGSDTGSFWYLVDATWGNASGNGIERQNDNHLLISYSAFYAVQNSQRRVAHGVFDAYVFASKSYFD